MNQHQTSRYKTLLERKKAHILKELTEMRTALSAEEAIDIIEEIAINREQEMKVKIVNRETELIHEIDASLQRLNEGVYGSCRRCHHTIRSKRLKALPWALFCLRCQEVVEGFNEAGLIESVLYKKITSPRLGMALFLLKEEFQFSS
jgi:DnaK suppressor protein